MTTNLPRTLTITVPAEGWISSNQREHWSARAARTRTWRNHAHWIAKGWPAYTVPVTITATVHRSSTRRADAHNVQPSVKAAIDGLVDAGVLVDDSDKYLHGVTFAAGEPRKPACLVLTITPQVEAA